MHKSIYLATAARCGTHWVKNVLLKLLNFKSGLDYPKITYKTMDQYIELIRKKEEKEPGRTVYTGHTSITDLTPIPMVNRIVLVRDPRDICVSAVYYWVMKEEISFDEFKPRLKGLLHGGGPNPDFNQSYIENRNKIPHYLLKFEDMVNDEYGTMTKLLKYFNYDFDPEKLKESLERYTFKKMSGGREVGEEKLEHYRKGIIGDWKNYLTEEMNEKFCETHKKLMESWGY